MKLLRKDGRGWVQAAAVPRSVANRAKTSSPHPKSEPARGRPFPSLPRPGLEAERGGAGRGRAGPHGGAGPSASGLGVPGVPGLCRRLMKRGRLRP